MAFDQRRPLSDDSIRAKHHCSPSHQGHLVSSSSASSPRSASMLESFAAHFQGHGSSPKQAPPEKHYDLSGPDCSFHFAVFAGEEDLVRQHLTPQAVNQATSRDGATPLHVVALTPHVTVARLLLEHGADVAALDRRRSTPLHNAALHGQPHLASLLVEAGADPAAKDMHNETPFFAAHRMHHKAVLKVLSQAGKEQHPNRQLELLAKFTTSFTTLSLTGGSGHGLRAVSSEPSPQQSQKTQQQQQQQQQKPGGVLPPEAEEAWLSATKAGDALRLRELVSRHGPLLLDHRDVAGRTSVHRAAALGHLEALECCLELGASAAAPDASGRTPLHWAAISSKEAAVTCLVKHLCGSVSAADEEGRSALHYAAAFGCTDVVMCLVEAGAKLTQEDNDGKTPWDWAKEKGNGGVLDMLEPSPGIRCQGGPDEQQQEEGAADADEQPLPRPPSPPPPDPQQLRMSLRRGAVFRREPPRMFICPITQDLMQDPVVAADGNTYDRPAIEAWYRRNLTSPLTNMAVEDTLIPNRMLRSEILNWVERNAAP